MTLQDIFVCFLAFLPTGWGILLIAQACKPLARQVGLWGSVRALARAYEIIMGVLLFTPITIFAWFPFVSEFQTRMLFNQVDLIALYTVGYRAEPLVRRNSGHIKKRRLDSSGP